MTVGRDYLGELARLAVTIAGEAPKRRSRYAHQAPVRWQTIEQIREVLEAAGIAWQASKRPAKGKLDGWEESL